MTKTLLKTIIVTQIIFIIILSFTIYNFNNNKNNEDTTFLLGYCPTMEEEANKIALNNNNIQTIKYQSTTDVLNNLNQNKIDIALVGRIAKTNELKQNFNELKLSHGFTLVNSNKNIIPHEQLSNIKIHTYLEKQQVKDFLGNIDNVIFYEKQEKINPESISLIDWEDYNQTHQLLIPVDENNLKIKKFRIPVLYSYKNLDNLKLI